MPVAKRAVPEVDAIPAFRPLVISALNDAKDQKLRYTAAFTAGFYPDREIAQLLLKTGR